MALFSTSQPAPNGSRRRTDASGFSIIAPDLQVTGNIDTPGIVKVEGQVRGSVRAGEQVLVSEGAVIEGDIVAREVVIGGVVQGGVEAGERVELLATAVVTGNVMTARLLIHEGGRVNGEIAMRGGEPASQGAASHGTIEPEIQREPEPVSL